MKRLIGIAALVLFMVSAGQAQNLKFGHVNSDELIRALPEFDTANANLEKFRQELVNNLEICRLNSIIKAMHLIRKARTT